MKRFISKVKETNGYKEQKVLVQQKIDAEKARIARKYEEKQQAKAQQEAEKQAQADLQAAQQQDDIDSFVAPTQTTTVALDDIDGASHTDTALVDTVGVPPLEQL